MNARRIPADLVLTLCAVLICGCGESPTDPERSPNRSPSAVMTADPTGGTAPLAVTFDATGSSDPDGSLASYRWDFGDGNSGTGARITYVYWKAGTHTARLTVVDDSGATASASVEVRVDPGNRLPNAVPAAVPSIGFAPLEVTLDGSGSSDADGNLVSYFWNLGDGGQATAATVSHVYETAGTYNAMLTVVDDSDAAASASIEINVLPESSHSGARIAFASRRAGSGDIYVMGADGSGLARLTDSVEDEGDPAWSPNGAALAFRRGSDIWIMLADGTRPLGVTRHRDEGAGSDSEPAWSPDGTRLAFTSDDWWLPQVRVTWIDGSHPVDLTEVGGFAPAWSPDGTRVAFSAWEGDDLGDDVLIVGADGSDPVNLTHRSGDDGHPAFSPDGTKIAFVSNSDGNSEIYVMEADGSNPVNLTRHPSEDSDPAWSPDGTEIAFVSSRDGNFDIYVMEADGADPVNLTRHPAADLHPAWMR